MPRTEDLRPDAEATGGGRMKPKLSGRVPPDKGDGASVAACAKKASLAAGSNPAPSNIEPLKSVNVLDLLKEQKGNRNFTYPKKGTPAFKRLSKELRFGLCVISSCRNKMWLEKDEEGCSEGYCQKHCQEKCGT